MEHETEADERSSVPPWPLKASDWEEKNPRVLRSWKEPDTKDGGGGEDSREVGKLIHIPPMENNPQCEGKTRVLHKKRRERYISKQEEEEDYKSAPCGESDFNSVAKEKNTKLYLPSRIKGVLVWTKWRRSFGTKVQGEKNDSPPKNNGNEEEKPGLSNALTSFTVVG